MYMRSVLLGLLVLVTLPALALKSGCPAEYNLQQCEQAKDDGGIDEDEGGGSGGTCPYDMCANATARMQDAWGWCEATQTEANCPIAYCEYQPCVGSNCYVSWIACSACSSRQGNNGHETECPKS